ncbi:MAG TPA: DUF4349 domain-containing protein [Actinomycetota bacterium]|nr:DUF4349 domain-containing protein [Actinomycetota bacterium]
MIKRFAATFVLILLLAFGAACGDRAQDVSSETQAAAPTKSEAFAGAATDADGSAADSVAAGRAGGGGALAAPAPEAAAAQAPVPDLPDVPPGGPASSRVIKNISLEVEIEDDAFQRQFARAGTVAEQFGGFVTNSQVAESDGELSSGSLTIRVPSNRFEEAVSRLKQLGKVKAEDRSGQDVSKQFVDLEARLRQAKTEEGFFLRLMDEAEGVSDMIQIQSQLSAVQLRIEEIQGQLNFLRDQTDFSTITVRLYEPGAPTGAPKGLAGAWEEAVDGFQSVIGGIVVGLGWLAPFALLGLVGWLVYRTRSRSRVAVTAEAPPASS